MHLRETVSLLGLVAVLAVHGNPILQARDERQTQSFDAQGLEVICGEKYTDGILAETECSVSVTEPSTAASRRDKYHLDPARVLEARLDRKFGFEARQAQPTSPVSQIADEQTQVHTSATSQPSDSHTQVPTSPVSQVADGQIQVHTSSALQPSDSTTQVPTSQVSQIADGQIQVHASQTSDSNMQVPTSPVSQIADGQIQVPTSPVTQIADGQIQVPTSPVTQIADGQIQVPTSPVTQIADGQIQVPTSPVTQIADGQVQVPTSAAQVSDRIKTSPAQNAYCLTDTSNPLGCQTIMPPKVNRTSNMAPKEMLKVSEVSAVMSIASEAEVKLLSVVDAPKILQTPILSNVTTVDDIKSESTTVARVPAINATISSPTMTVPSTTIPSNLPHQTKSEGGRIGAAVLITFLGAAVVVIALM